VLPTPTPPPPEAPAAPEWTPSTPPSWASSSSALDDTSPSPPPAAPHDGALNDGALKVAPHDGALNVAPRDGALEVGSQSSAQPVAPRNGDGADSGDAAGGESDADRSAGGIFRPLEDTDAIFGEPPALFQNPEDLAPAVEPVQVAGADRPGEPAEPFPAPAPPSGRGLADLYYSQGHYAEALQIYDDLVTRHPFDEELMRMRREAEARLLPAGQVHSSVAPDPGVERRRARIRVLERFLSRVQAG
jgi:hypothetical protein